MHIDTSIYVYMYIYILYLYNLYLCFIGVLFFIYANYAGNLMTLNCVLPAASAARAQTFDLYATISKFIAGQTPLCHMTRPKRALTKL